MTFHGPAGIVERANGVQTRALRALKTEIRAACATAGLSAMAAHSRATGATGA